ncbi:hypothetical protein QBC43DRAFT_312581 [Cladorrhinum sp. PSN259]|nr:hypothetical protein QBC43DRAFT_312581 [Cladorrhinum sp. PSN259]
MWLLGTLSPYHHYAKSQEKMALKQAARTRTTEWLEMLLESFILALRGLVPMLWLRSRVSPIQFLIGGIVLVLVTLLFNPRSSLELDEGSKDPVKIKGILRNEQSRKERRRQLSVNFDIPMDEIVGSHCKPI